MVSLPEDRLIPEKPPFTYVGIDHFGPLEVKQDRSRVKRYRCLFTCLTTRAVHLKIAHFLDTDSMINALRRFISVRGKRGMRTRLTSCTVTTRAKRQRKGEPVNRDGITVLTRPVTRLCLLEMD